MSSALMRSVSTSCLEVKNMREEVTIKCDVSEKALDPLSCRRVRQLPLPPGHSHKLSNNMHELKKSAQPFSLPPLSSVSTLPCVKVTVESDHKLTQPIFVKSLLPASCRLQRNLLQFQRYDLKVKQITDSQCLWEATCQEPTFKQKAHNLVMNFSCLQ